MFLKFTNALQTYGEKMVPGDNHHYYRCKSHGNQVWIAKRMAAFTEFSACFIWFNRTLFCLLLMK